MVLATSRKPEEAAFGAEQCAGSAVTNASIYSVMPMTCDGLRGRPLLSRPRVTISVVWRRTRPELIYRSQLPVVAMDTRGYIRVDGQLCCQSGASFKGGANRDPGTLTQ